MSPQGFAIRPERPEDFATVAALSARAIGPGRFARTAYRIREGTEAAAGLSLVAEHGGSVAGAIRFTEVCVGGLEGALLLGPLVVAPEVAGQGCGKALIAAGLEEAKRRGHQIVLLVGDLAYYEKSGFRPCRPGSITFPGPVDLARLLAAELVDGAAERFSGRVSRCPAVST